MFTKITDADLTNKGVVGLPDTPNLSTTEMQEKFDEIANDVIIPKFNNLVDEMADSSAAENIGAVDTLGNPTTVQELLSDIKTNGYTREQADEKFVAKEEGKTLTSNDFTDEDKEKLDSLENYELPIGTVETLGGVKPDNETFTIDENGVGHAIGGGGTGTADYNALINKPQINGVTLIGNKSAEDLGLQTEIKLVHITVNYETDVIGGTITCRNGAEVETFIADESLSHTFDLMSLGTWIISEDATDTSETVVADFYGNYATSLGGKVKIVVNYAEDMVGKHITVTHDGVTKTKVASGTSIGFSFKPHGEFTVGEDLNNQTKVVNATVDGTYTVDFKASINVTISDLLVGNAITCSDGATTLTWISDSSEHTFVVSKFGTWVVTNVDTGATVEVIVSDYAEYSADFGTMSWQGWLESASIPTSSFTDLESVLASETTVRTLMNKHSSVDYLAEWIVSDETTGRTILNNDLCAKWINLKDYALDTLYSNFTVKAIMDEVDKYFYGEWVLNDAIPITTNDNGKCVASTSVSGYEPFKAFDGNDSTFWSSSTTDVTDAKLYYKFDTPTVVKKVSFRAVYGNALRVKTFSVIGYDGNNWEIIREVETLPNTTTEYYERELDNNKAYLYVGLGNLTTYKDDVDIYSLQFYAWQPKGNVPIMTSNNAPYGEVFVSSIFNTNWQGYYVFDNDNSNGWASADSDATPMLAYKFVNPICCRKLSIKSASGNTTENVKVELSNDNFATIGYSKEFTYVGSGAITDVNLENDNFYLYARINFMGHKTNTNHSQIDVLQFYGRELKVSVPTMTSNTEPFGEVIADSNTSNREGFRAFDNDIATYYYGSSNGHIGYDFKNSVKVKLAMVYGSGGRTQVIQGSNEDGVWENVSESFSTTSDKALKVVECNSEKAYSKYRVLVTNNQLASMFTLQFYGLDYSEHDERHYIYDHGVELEKFSFIGTMGGNLQKNENSMLIKSVRTETIGKIWDMVSTDDKIDLSAYSFARYAVGQTIINASGIAVYPNTIPYYGDDDRNLAAFIEIFVGSANQWQYPYLCNMDIKAFNDDNVVALRIGQNSTYEVTEWWLE